MATLQLPLAANQAVNTFTVSKSPLADVHQETLQALDPESRQTTEVFPGSYVSPYGAAVMKLIGALVGRVDELDRSVLVAEKVGVGFDRSITRWRADPPGRTVALAARYYRDRLIRLDMKFSNDYGGPEPIDPAEYEFFTVAVCTRAGAGSWACREEPLAAVARKHNLALPNNRADQDAVVEKLLELVLADK